MENKINWRQSIRRMLAAITEGIFALVFIIMLSYDGEPTNKAFLVIFVAFVVSGISLRLMYNAGWEL